MSGIALLVERGLTGVVQAGENVVFESTVYTSGNIDYDNGNGVITLKEPGRYLFHWWVTTQLSAIPHGVLFALSSSKGDFLVGNSPLKTGETTGMGIITVDNPPVKVWLVNAGTGQYHYAAELPCKASLMVVQESVAVPQSTRCFAVAQLAHLLSQMITIYADTTWTVFSQSLASYSGKPLDLYQSPQASGPGILRLIDENNEYEALPLQNITAIYPGGGTVYDPALTYLSPPEPLPQDCDADLLAAIQSYLPPGTPVEIRLGPTIVASGEVYRNEFGLIVLSNAAGETPVFIPALQILRIFTSDSPVGFRGDDQPRIEIRKE